MATPLQTFTFDAGAEGAALAAGGAIASVTGTHNYAAASALHGARGLTPVGATSSGPTFTVTKAGAGVTAADGAHTVSLYYRPKTVPGGAVQLCNIQTAANAIIGLVRANKNSSKFDIAVNGTAAASSTLLWALDTIYRLDITFSGDTAKTITVKVFAGANAEGTVPDDTFSTTGLSSAAAFDHWVFSAGRSTTAGCVGDLDTVRIYDGVVTPDPFAAPAPDTTAPTVPTAVTASAQSPTSVLVSWSPSTDDVGVASYRVRRNGVDLAGATAVTGTSFTDTTASPSTAYTYTVSAVDAAGNRSAESTAATATTPAATDAQAPTVPTGVTATAQSPTSVKVSWTASTDNVGVASYRLRRNGVDVTGATALTGTTYTDTGLTGNTAYSYTVSAVDAAGNRSAESTAASATTPPATSTATVPHLWLGAPTRTGFRVVARTVGATAVRLAVSTDQGMASPVYTGPKAPDSAGYVDFTVTGLTAGTRYWYQLEDTPTGQAATPVGAVGRAKTLPAGNSFTFALSACITTNAADAVALNNLRNWDPDLNVFTGDFHYSGTASSPTTETGQRGQYESQIAGAAGLAAMIRDVPMAYITSDHEAGPDNGDSNNAYTVANIDAYKRIVPAYQLADTRSPTVGRYQSWVVGRVRFIMIDVRNTERTPGLTADSASKTMLGATQKAWLKARLLDPEPVKVIVSDVAWMGAASTSNGEDKWWSYAVERQEIADFINANGVKVVLVHGDSHAIGVATPAKNTWGGFPVYCAAPLVNTGGGRNLTAFSSYWNNAGGAARVYGRVTVTDTGDQITFTYSGWDAAADVERVAQTDTFAITAAPAAKKVKVGGLDPSSIYVGSSAVSRLYVGATQLWP